MCVKSCVGFTGLFVDLEHCPECGLAHGSAIISPMVLANTSSQNASVVGSYVGVHRMYAPDVLVMYHPVLLGPTLAVRLQLHQ